MCFLQHQPQRAVEGTTASASFAEFVECVLVENDSPFTVYIAEEDIVIPTPDPELSQPSAMLTEDMPEHTADLEL